MPEHEETTQKAIVLQKTVQRITRGVQEHPDLIGTPELVPPKIVTKVVGRILTLFKRNPPAYDEFGLPSYEPRIHICDQGNPVKLVLKDFDIGKTWVLGWLKPADPNPEQAAGIKLRFNGESISSEDLFPEDTFDLVGEVSCISLGKTKLGPHAERGLKENISALIKEKIYQWLTEIDAHAYEQSFQPILASSLWLQDVLVKKKHPQYIELAKRFHEFETNRGRMTGEKLLHAAASQSGVVYATRLPSSNFLLEQDFMKQKLSEAVIVDLSKPYVRTLAEEIIWPKGGKIQYVDDLPFLSSILKIRDPDADYIDLTHWFDDAFKNSPHLQGVRVKMCYPDALRFPPALYYCSDKLLLLNAQSKLVHHLRELPHEAKTRQTIPSMVFQCAEPSALEKSNPGYQHNQWEYLTQHLGFTAQCERKLAEKESGHRFWVVTEQATLARFVDPKSESVQRILNIVRQRRKRGYIDDTPAVVAEVLYDSLKEERIIYEGPPVEQLCRRAQRIRSHEEVIVGKVGTCIDLALLFAAFLEGAEKRAVIVHYLDKSYGDAHAVCGFWTKDDGFSGDKPYCENASEFRRKVDDGSLCLVECIGFSFKDVKQKSFNDAILEAKDYALGKLPKLRACFPFNFALCIETSREQDIIPM